MATERKTLRTRRTTVRRHPERALYDWPVIAAILDEAIFCHIGFVLDGQPYVIPTAYGRDGRAIYIHGSSASRMLRAISRHIPICFTASLIDGLVFARSAFKHSINYRSVVILGTARLAVGDDKLHGLEVITEHIAAGRWREIRHPTDQELKATHVIRLDIEEASAKVRSGGTLDYEEDFDFPVWAGHLPLTLVAGTPVPHHRLDPAMRLPLYLAPYKRPAPNC